MHLTYPTRNAVLIETLWNVNSVGSGTSKVTGIVLIETLWNVNLPANNL